MSRRLLVFRSLLAGVLLVAAAGCTTPFVPDPPPPAPPPLPPPVTVTASVSMSGNVLASQQASLWCWAASASNLFAHYGHPATQARIVSEVYGAPVNAPGGDYANLAGLLNRTWRDDAGRVFSARLMAALDVPNRIDEITNDQIRDALRGNRPLIVGTTTHAMLMVGMTYQELNGHVTNVISVRVFDPWPGVGVRTLSAAEMTPSPRGGTLLFIADAAIS